MPDIFFDDRFIVKTLRTSGAKRRYSATATVDGNVQQDDSVSRSSDTQSNYLNRYIAFVSGQIETYVKGRKMVSIRTGVVYMIDGSNLVIHPITGTEYIEVILIKDTSKPDGSRNDAS